MFTLRHDTTDSVSAVALAADGRVAAGTSGGEVVVWESLTGDAVVYPAPGLRPPSVLSLSFTNRREVVAVFDSKLIAVYGEGAPRWITTEYAAHWCAISESGGQVATANRSAVRVWDVVTGQMVCERELACVTIGAVAFDPTRRAVVTTADAVRFWSLDDNRLVAEVGKLTHRPIAVACSPDGRRVVTMFADSFRVWDVETGEAVRDVPVTNQMRFTALAFHPSGRLLTAGSRGVVQTWDAGTWAESSAFAWGVGWVRACAVSPDGLTAAVGGNLGHVAVWDVE